ncbi:hypothetical protein F5B20DRAFT_148933 [Whalleya microplaca]|nr:hypothetical protein F5B20DRAFT_148933 [Whalleya microplaca]
MTLLQKFLHLTNFHSPLLRTAVPSVAAAFALQTAVAIPSIRAQSERFYDASGSVTFLAVTALSLYLPSLRARAPFAIAALNWRQLALSAAVAVWSIRLGSYLLARIQQTGHDSRFDGLRTSPPKFLAAWLGQATWVSLVLLPVIAVNAVPAPAFAALPGVLATDVLGLALLVGGFAFEVVADRQKSAWLDQRRRKVHDEGFLTRGLWSRSQYPNYFGECTLWTGIATAAAGVLVRRPVQVGLGLSGGLSGRLLALALSFASPAFTSFLLLKVTGVPLSETKYDKKYGDRKDYQEWKQNTPKFFPRL